MLSTRQTKNFDFYGGCVLYCGAIFSALLCQMLAALFAEILKPTIPDISQNGIFLTAFMVVIQLFGATFILLFCRHTGYRPTCSLVKNDDGKFVYTDLIYPIIAAVLLYVVMYLPTMWYGSFTTDVLGIPPERGSIDVRSVAARVLVVVATVFLAPICEETVYRGVLFNALATKKSAFAAVFLSALSFMLMHMSPLQVVFQFALGAASACIMLECNRLLPCVLFHSAANAIALTISLTPLNAVLDSCVTLLMNNVAAAVFVIALGVCGLWLLIFRGFKKRTNVSTTADDDRIESAPALSRRRDGRVPYYFTLGICALLFIANLVAEMTT